MITIPEPPAPTTLGEKVPNPFPPPPPPAFVVPFVAVPSVPPPFPPPPGPAAPPVPGPGLAPS